MSVTYLKFSTILRQSEAKMKSVKIDVSKPKNHQDGKIMVLVEQEVHTKFTHQGGASMVQKR